MGKAKSQWDFGELFPPESARQVWSVTELTGRVRRLIEKEIGSLWVTGEVTNLRVQSSGHVYFTLKDASAQLPCVLFRTGLVTHREALRDGQKLVLGGDLTVYEPRGQYQLRVTAIELHGAGALQIAFERLKQKLQAEGLFAQERKRPLPRFPRCVGIVTSPTGAALRDVLHVVERRHPGLGLILVACRVQGQGAAEEIAGAIRFLNAWSQDQPRSERLDLILVTRGGGSLEDLWAFNEEVVARAIFESALPVMSAVGHEIDFTISDFVADVRAATPSAAAELITEGAFASRRFLAHALEQMQRLARRRLLREQQQVAQWWRRLARVHPRRVLNEKLQYLDDLQTALIRCARQNWRVSHRTWLHLHQRLNRVRPSQQVGQRRKLVVEWNGFLIAAARLALKGFRSRLAQHESRLRLLSPENVLSRGYSITMDAQTGAIVRSAGQLTPGQGLETKLQKGTVRSRVEKT